MYREQWEALVDAASTEPVAFDGLRVTRNPTDETYTFETPSVTHDGLDTDAFEAVAQANPWYVSNWYVWTHAVTGEVPRAFCRWLERADERSVAERYEALADGCSREWGQLSVTATHTEHGERRYHVRHVDDRAASPADLEVHTDPYAVRDLVRTDPSGRYRPLKTAPTLRAGWTVVELDAADVVRTVDLIYPVSIHNWHREREGRLDVSHWRATADRQSGMYALVDGLAPEAVAWLAEACCVDSQCLKRREWDYDADRPLDVPAGDGAFPCREPCSLVIAAARQWTIQEREEPRTYEFELTPSEKEQVEVIIDAVADGRIDEIREADIGDGANRYRARYLRAKRFDADGNLSGTPTGDGE